MRIRDLALATSAIALCLAVNNQVKAANCEGLASLSLDQATVGRRHLRAGRNIYTSNPTRSDNVTSSDL